MNYPTVSFIITTYNSGRTMRQCLTSIRQQKYPQNKLEIIIVDAGSTDETLSIARNYRARIVKKPHVLQEPSKAYGLQIAIGEYIGAIDSDNIFPSKTWLVETITPLLQDKTLAASYPLQYTYQKDMSTFNRCVALFGVNDPTPYFLRKADRQSYHYSSDEYRLSGKSKDCGNYFQAEFTPRTMPTLGANGFIIKKSLLEKAHVDPDHFFHIDVIYDLVKLGYTRFAVVKNSIIHDTAGTLFSLLRKRNKYLNDYYFLSSKFRRYFIVKPHDYQKLLLFSLYSLTIIFPLIESIKGYRKVKDTAWFVFPIFCFGITIVYAKAYLTRLLFKK